MNRFLTFLLLLPLLVLSCGKQDKTTETKQNPPKTSSNTDVTSSSAYYHVKTTGENVKQNESVDFTWTENGKDVKLSDYRGKVILLNFWATWCGPCRREIPDLSQISADLKDKDFKIIGISIDQNPAALDNYLKSSPSSYTIVHESGDLLAKYMQASGNMDDVIPQSFIIDKNGKITEAIIGGRSKSDFLKLINKYL